MTKKDYEAAARIAQRELHPDTRALIVAAFVAFFRTDSRFNEERFRRACEPGANVKAKHAPIAPPVEEPPWVCLCRTGEFQCRDDRICVCAWDHHGTAQVSPLACKECDRTVAEWKKGK